jgi:hypothetical protein
MTDNYKYSLTNTSVLIEHTLVSPNWWQTKTLLCQALRIAYDPNKLDRTWFSRAIKALNTLASQAKPDKLGIYEQEQWADKYAHGLQLLQFLASPPENIDHYPQKKYDDLLKAIEVTNIAERASMKSKNNPESKANSFDRPISELVRIYNSFYFFKAYIQEDYINYELKLKANKEKKVKGDGVAYRSPWPGANKPYVAPSAFSALDDTDRISNFMIKVVNVLIIKGGLEKSVYNPARLKMALYNASDDIEFTAFDVLCEASSESKHVIWFVALWVYHSKELFDVTSMKSALLAVLQPNTFYNMLEFTGSIFECCDFNTEPTTASLNKFNQVMQLHQAMRKALSVLKVEERLISDVAKWIESVSEKADADKIKTCFRNYATVKEKGLTASLNCISHFSSSHLRTLNNLESSHLSNELTEIYHDSINHSVLTGTFFNSLDWPSILKEIHQGYGIELPVGYFILHRYFPELEQFINKNDEHEFDEAPTLMLNYDQASLKVYFEEMKTFYQDLDSIHTLLLEIESLCENSSFKDKHLHCELSIKYLLENASSDAIRRVTSIIESKMHIGLKVANSPSDTVVLPQDFLAKLDKQTLDIKSQHSTLLTETKF